MAYITQMEIDDKQEAKRNAFAGQAANAIGMFEENRKRALAEKRAAYDTVSKFAEFGVQASPQEIDELTKTGASTGLMDKYSAKAEESRLRKHGTEDTDRRYKEWLMTSRGSAGSRQSQPTYEEKLTKKANHDKQVKLEERADPVNKLDKLGAEGKLKVGAIASGFQALDQMAKASDDGYEPRRVSPDTPLIGGFVSDDPYSEGERMTSEVVGRLQSGGAMNKDEVATFRALGPRPGDDAESRKRKLGQQRDFLHNKLTAFGMSDSDLKSLGFETSSKYVPKNQVTPEDQDAVNWAKSNPDDPRAIKILQIHGAK